jgi:hypothetical protein
MGSCAQAYVEVVRPFSSRSYCIPGSRLIDPQSQALIVRLPIGGWGWNRPTAIVVEREGRASRWPIIDLTRILQLWLLGESRVLVIVDLVKFTQRKEQRS